MVILDTIINHRNIHTFTFSIFLCLFAFSTNAQDEIEIAEIRIGDEITFKAEEDAKRFTVIGIETENFNCSIYNAEEKLDSINVSKRAVVKAFKNSLNRKRVNIFNVGTKLKWKQKGKLTEGFVKEYNPAGPNVICTVYENDKVGDRAIPAKYATLSFGDSQADTLQMLCSLWESADQLFEYNIVDSLPQGDPLIGKIKMGETTMSKKFQYVFEDYKFAMVYVDNLNYGIIGSWKIENDQLHVTTKMAAVKSSEDGKRKAVPTEATYIYDFEISQDGKALSLNWEGWQAYIDKKRAEEAAKKAALEAELAAIQDSIKRATDPTYGQEEINTEGIETGEIDQPMDIDRTATGTTSRPNRIPSKTNQGNTHTSPSNHDAELAKVHAELEAMRKEMQELKELLKKTHKENEEN